MQFRRIFQGAAVDQERLTEQRGIARVFLPKPVAHVRLINVKLGFNPKNVLTLRVELPRSRYVKSDQRKQFFEQLLERVKSTPGIQSAGAISQLPLSGYSMLGRFTIEGQPKPEPGKGKPMPIGIVTPEYFPTMQIPLLQGRFFVPRDIEGMPKVAIVNESMARRFWPGENPIGKKVAAGCEEQALCRTVIGVVGDIRHESLADEAQPEIYMPHLQFALPGMSLVMRTAGDPLTLVSAVRNHVHALDKDQPIALVQTLGEHVSQSVLQPRLTMTSLSIFASLALSLAAVGVYAMMSYSVSQRHGEIGIRIALGALKADIFRLVVGQAMLLVAISLTIGLAGALAATRLLGSQPPPWNWDVGSVHVWRGRAFAFAHLVCRRLVSSSTRHTHQPHDRSPH